MHVEILSKDKNSVDFNIDNVTISEVMRVYLQEQGVQFAAWRREHPSKPLNFKIIAGEQSLSKCISGAGEAIIEDCDKILAVVKK